MLTPLPCESRSVVDAPLGAVIDYLLEQHHEPLRRDLTALIALAERVETATAARADGPRGLTAHLRAMATAVEDHLLKEERILFPMIRAGHGAQAQMPVRVMMHEHDDHAADLTRVRALTTDLVAPADAERAWHDLYTALRALDAALREHIRIENEILFPRALRDRREA